MTGLVSIVGAGPGDPDLITVGALERLKTADVVLYDRLVDRRLVDQSRPGAELIDVGKTPGGRGRKQADINSLLIDRARDGKSVVRLKGGDPFVFGRGGEEADALQAAGIPFEVLPGVSSATAAAAYAGIPVTHRGLASSLTIVTGSEAPGKPDSDVDWEALAAGKGTLVVMMGWQNIDAIVGALISHGRSPDTPVALVSQGSTPDQRTVVGTLGDIVARAAQEDIGPPVVAVIGDVVTLRDRIAWFEGRPLHGKRVLVTRTREQAGELSRLLSRRGAVPMELPTIEIRPLDGYTCLDQALGSLARYDWVVFASANAVDAVFARLAAMRLDSRAFAGARVAAVGQATAGKLRSHGIEPDLVPSGYSARDLEDEFADRDMKNARVLLPRADIAPDTLPRGLTGLGAVVEEVTAYKTATPVSARADAAEVLRSGLDAAMFTSSSTVTNLVGLLDGGAEALSGVLIACIGPVTAETAGRMGLDVDIVAREHTVPGLVEALEEHFTVDD